MCMWVVLSNNCHRTQERCSGCYFVIGDVFDVGILFIIVTYFVRIYLEISSKSKLQYAGIRLAYTQFISFMWVNLFFHCHKTQKWYSYCCLTQEHIFGCGTLCLIVIYFVRIQFKISSKPRYRNKAGIPTNHDVHVSCSFYINCHRTQDRWPCYWLVIGDVFGCGILFLMVIYFVRIQLEISSMQR